MSDLVDPQDNQGMRLALDQAHNAWLVGEVPVGAVIVRPGSDGLQVVATGYNRPITTHDPTAHAEIVALRHAATLLANYRLPECVLYVTLEPCAMCAMALLHARFKRVVFGAPDPKSGVAGSLFNLFDDKRLNHHTQLSGGVLADACGRVLRDFFAERRAQQRARRGGALGEPGVVADVGIGAGRGVGTEADAGAPGALAGAPLRLPQRAPQTPTRPPCAPPTRTPPPSIPAGDAIECDVVDAAAVPSSVVPAHPAPVAKPRPFTDP